MDRYKRGCCQRAWNGSSCENGQDLRAVLRYHILVLEETHGCYTGGFTGCY